jgi:hypothetical protein
MVIDQGTQFGMDARTAALGFDEGESGRSAGHRQKGRETQAVAAEIVSAGDGLMRGGARYVRGMAVGMRHGPELGKQQRGSGDYRDAKLKTMKQFGQGHPQ